MDSCLRAQSVWLGSRQAFCPDAPRSPDSTLHAKTGGTLAFIHQKSLAQPEHAVIRPTSQAHDDPSGFVRVSLPLTNVMTHLRNYYWDLIGTRCFPPDFQYFAGYHASIFAASRLCDGRCPRLGAGFRAGAASCLPGSHEWVKVAADIRTVYSFVAYPETNSRMPAVVVIHGNRGLIDWVRSFAGLATAELPSHCSGAALLRRRHPLAHERPCQFGRGAR